MISTQSLIIFGLLLLNVSILVQSAPVKRKKINVREAPVHVSDKSIHTDNSDINMNSNELINLLRKRRNIHFNDHFKNRHKRSLSTFELYNTDPLYESLFIQPQSFNRPTRSFAPIYWPPPSSLERNIRLALESSVYEPSEWNRIYPNTIETDDIDDDQNPFYINDYDEENNYEYNRYPISFDIPYDNLQLQQEYNTDDLPIDEDEEFLPTRYNLFGDYFK